MMKEGDVKITIYYKRDGDKGGNLAVRTSGTKDTHKILGILEDVKNQILIKATKNQPIISWKEKGKNSPSDN